MDTHLHTSFSRVTMRREDLLPGRTLSVGGCLIMLCLEGRAKLSVNSRRFILKPGRMAVLTYDMVAVTAGVSPGFEAACMSVSLDATQDIFFLVTSNRFWDFIYRTPVFALPSDLVAPVCQWFGLTGWMAGSCPQPALDRMLRNETENFMLGMVCQTETRLGQLGDNPAKNRAWSIINDFIALIGRHYAAHHDVAFYAGKLNVTPNYLNIIARRTIGTTAKEQINIQIGLVARMLLDTTDMTVRQIADRLHYEAPSYLCRVIRRQTGMSPIEYRNKLRGNSN